MSASQDDENYWPGYVDALTTMTMVLTFIMLVLGLAVFTLSQNVSKGMLETIASAINVSPDMPQDLSTEDITKRVLERIEQQQAALADAQTAVAALRSGREPVNEGAASVAPGAAAATLPQDNTIQTLSNAPDRQAAMPVTVGAAKGVLRLVYLPRATGLDEAARTALATALAPDGALHQVGTLEMVAGVDRSNLAVSDANRVAYYRALIVRSRLIEAGVPPGRLKVRVDPEASPNEVVISARP